MTDTQRELARHALGFPNKKNESYRNRFCTGPGDSNFEIWLAMVSQGDAIKIDGPFWGGDSMFHLTLKGALEARESKERLSQEDSKMMRELEEAIR